MIEKWFTFFLGRGHAYSENGDGSRAGDSNNVDTTTSKCTHKHIRLFIPLLNVLWFVLLFLKLALNAHSSIHYDIQFISFKCRQYNAIKCAIDHRKRDDVKNWENAKKEKSFAPHTQQPNESSTLHFGMIKVHLAQLNPLSFSFYARITTKNRNVSRINRWLRWIYIQSFKISRFSMTFDSEK